MRTSLAWDKQEAHSLQFFDEITLKHLQVFFSDELWSKYLPQVAYTHSSIRHALVALAGYHERYTNSSLERSNNSTALAFRHYSLSIKQLTGNPGEPSQQIHLISCLIFFCIEVTLQLTTQT